MEGLRDRGQRCDEDDRRHQGASDHPHGGRLRHRPEGLRASALPLPVPSGGCRALASLSRWCVRSRSRWRLRCSSPACCRRPLPRTSAEFRRQLPTISLESRRSRTASMARIVDGDQAIWMRAKPSLTVVVTGLRGEPYLRFSSAGVAVNTRSATWFLNRVYPQVVPRGLTPSTSPQWKQLTSRHSWTWHEGRLHTPALSAHGSGERLSRPLGRTSRRRRPTVLRSAAVSGSLRPRRSSGSGRSSWSRPASPPC